MSDDYFREQLAAERAENKAHQEARLGLRYLAGKYSHRAERDGNTELANLVREMTEVLDGTWQRPEGI